MSRDVLIKDLRAKGEAQIEALWQEAREELEQFRAEAEERVSGEHDRCDLAGREVQQTVQRRRTMAARRRAEAIVTRAEQQLGDRLYQLTRSLLDGDWSGDRAVLLTRLGAELPSGEWGRILVNPADAQIAKKLFPQAEIATESEIAGGLAATSRDGRITIDNTLSTRLDRAWSRLAPKLLHEVNGDAETG